MLDLGGWNLGNELLGVRPAQLGLHKKGVCVRACVCLCARTPDARARVSVRVPVRAPVLKFVLRPCVGLRASDKTTFNL